MWHLIIEVWASLESIHTNILSLAFTFLAAAVFYFFRPRVRLIYGTANNSLNSISVPDPNNPERANPVEIYVEKFFVQNLGRSTATNVEFILSSFPNDVAVFQPREVEYKAIEKGNCLMKIPQIAPWELVVIDCAYINQRAAWITSVKCAEAVGKEVPFFTVRRLPEWFYHFALLVFILGIAMVLQLLIQLVV